MDIFESSYKYAKPQKVHIHPLVKVGKWIMDKAGGAFGVLITLILLPIIAILIKLDSKGPLFFSQIRVGKGTDKQTKIFHIYKFRTMSIETGDNLNGFLWTTQDDPRTTRVGRILRKYRIDEFPQFFNVLIGDMSLVGPRPMPPIFFRELEKQIPFYGERIVSVAPGITGLAQIYIDKKLETDEATKKILYEREKVGYDHSYALVLSKPGQWLYLDFKILLFTIKNALLGKGD